MYNCRFIFFRLSMCISVCISFYGLDLYLGISLRRVYVQDQKLFVVYFASLDVLGSFSTIISRTAIPIKKS